ncbi:MAG: hypothetical protein DSZ23_05285 [Thermodesulfatator sp.]|nr:MAG: hypothetical protein DSZ23_05285 [Thermodesulfatator sp.]
MKMVHDRCLLLKIRLPGSSQGDLDIFKERFLDKKFSSAPRHTSTRIETDTIIFQGYLSEAEIDSYLKTVLDRLEHIYRNDPDFLEKIEIEVSDGSTDESALDISEIPLDDGWRILNIAGRDETSLTSITSPPLKAILLKTRWAFGSGRHPTTLGAASALFYLHKRGILKGARVLDVGTGSGILAIIAAKLGAMEIIGVDIDENAIKNARQNVLINQAADTVTMTSKPIDALNLEKQDVIVANLTPSVLNSLLDNLVNTLQRNGFLVLSGYRSSARSRPGPTMKRLGMETVFEIEKDGWSTQIFAFVRREK